MAKEMMNSAGGFSPAPPVDSAVRTDRSGSQPTSTPGSQADSVYVNDSRTKLAKGDVKGSQAAANNIKNPATRAQVNNEISSSNVAKNAASPPPALQLDGSGGLSDPLALFFMMVFYLKEATPTFNWQDVLNTAKDLSNQKFENVTPDDAFLPQRTFQDSGTATAGTGAKGQVEAQQRANEEALKKQNDANQQLASFLCLNENSFRFLIVW